jgi:hypothetical protein
VAVVSVDDQATIGGNVNSNVLEIDFPERQMLVEEAKEVVGWVAQFGGPSSTLQEVCAQPVHTILLQHSNYSHQDRTVPTTTL